MVQFIFGLEPDSIHLQINQYYQQANNKLSELPNDFSYLWLSDKTMLDIISLEHENALSSRVKELFTVPSRRSSTMIWKIIQSIRILYSHIPQAELELNLKELQDVLNIVDLCLSFDPDHRPTIADLLNHPVFTENKNLKLSEVLQGISKMVPVRTLKH
jgi:serine/threonine protein kinase